MEILEKINHSVVSDSDIIVWNEYFSIIRYKDEYIFQWADRDLRR